APLLVGDGADDARERLRFAEELHTRHPDTAAARHVARLVLRHAYLDHVRGLVRIPGGVAADLARATADHALIADRSTLVGRPRAPLARAAPPVEIRVVERGAVSVHDAIVLPRQRLLLALGEAGVRLVDACGKTLTHVDELAHRLVAPD